MGKRLYSVIMFAVVSVLGGLLSAGMLVPIAGMATTAGTGMVSSLDNLPTELRETKQWQRSRLLNADGSVLAYFYDENRVLKPLSSISKIMQQAQVAIEDHRFYEHGAMDLQGTLRALVSTSQGNTQGGSSLTQQYVRLVLVEQAEENNDARAKTAATENTLARKVRELRYAIAVEKKFSKDEILERYLNIAYYGDGAYGVEAAARHYFGVGAQDLNLPQAAMLAGLVRNPVQSNPRTHPEIGLQRRNDVLDRMASLGVITPEQAAEAKATKFDQKKVRFSRKGCANSKMPFICDYALEVLKQQATALGATEEERLQRVYRGGLTITTEIDPKAQKQAQKVVSRTVHAKDPAIGVVVMMDPQTGLIKAMAQSRPEMGKKKGQTYYNYAVGRAFNGADGFQGGSTFKMFVAAAALENGFGVNTSFNVQPAMNYQGKYFPSCSGSVKVTRPWTVRGPQNGTYNLYTGTSGSVNNYFVQLEQKVGLCKVTKMAKKAGLQLASGADIVEQFNGIPSFALGAAEITPLSMITSFGTMANRGTRCSPVIIKSITTPDGKKEPVPSANCKPAVSEELADAVNKVFQGPFQRGTLTSARVPGYNLAGKTGTVPLNKAIWAVGYTPNLVTAAVISYDNNPKHKKFWKARGKRYLSGVRLPYSHTYLTGFGSDVGRKMFRPAMTQGLSDIKDHDRFVEPVGAMLRGDTASVPNCEGMSVNKCRAAIEAVGFGSYVKKVYSSTVPAGGLVGTNRFGEIPKGSNVGVEVSKGPKRSSSPPGPSAGPGGPWPPNRKPR